MPAYVYKFSLISVNTKIKRSIRQGFVIWPKFFKIYTDTLLMELEFLHIFILAATVLTILAMQMTVLRELEKK